MSEYQYYEFAAIDRPLMAGELDTLRSLSTRARITPTSFVNTYEWGSFRGDPRRLVERYFDAFLYLANWGTRELMLRFPARLIDLETAQRYCTGDSVSAWSRSDHVIVSAVSEDEEADLEWGGEGVLASILPVRAELLAGDERVLYLLWRDRAAAAWIREATADDTTAADLTLAPRAIRDRLEAFAAANEYQQVIALHQAMAAAARTWQRALAHAVSGGPDPDKQEVLWRTLQAYVGMWGEQVDTHSPRIAVVVDQLSVVLTEAVWRACARAAADDAPEELVDEQVRRWSSTWSTLRTWFAGTDGQARRLRRQLRDLVAPWARNMQLLMESGGAVTRRAELLRLATTIERAPDESTAWSLWDTATGGFTARHLLLLADDADAPARSWSDASSAPVTARFRDQGVKAAVGRRPAARDFSAGRAAARRERAAELAARRDAEVSLRHRSGTRLSTWQQVSGPELDLVLELFGVVRRTAGAPIRTAVTADGRWWVTLTSSTEGPATAVLRSPSGQLVLSDCRFDLEPAR